MSHDKKVGHFMVAVGAVIENSQTGLVLLQQRADGFQANEWELPYGRVDQFEELSEALARELFEETGLTDIKPQRLLRVWHFYRGQKSAETEVYGLTFHCLTSQTQITQSDEHQAYKWTTAVKALDLIKVPGIHADMKIYQAGKNSNWQNFQLNFGTDGKPLDFKL